jgi:hypothetical protein
VPVGIDVSPPMLYVNLKQLYPTVAFSDIATPSETEPYWYGVFEWNFAPTDVPYDKNIKELGLVKNSQGVWRFEFELVNASAEEIAERTAEKAWEVRIERNSFLLTSDWVDLPTPIKPISPELKQKFDLYRQVLRDIPAQPEFPFNTVFPVRPDKE